MLNLSRRSIAALVAGFATFATTGIAAPSVAFAGNSDLGRELRAGGRRANHTRDRSSPYALKTTDKTPDDFARVHTPDRSQIGRAHV